VAQLTVQFAHDKGHFRIRFAIDGEIEPGGIVACREGVLPVFASMVAAQLEHDMRWRGGELHRWGTPPSIVVAMPNGNALTFELVSVQERGADRPKPFLRLPEGGGTRKPVDAGGSDTPWKSTAL
jgi:hypothetical protein